tara:strand:- start:171 stop:347 length:177 start_codon:yes stop_codon:yes gene_type:complete
MVKIKQENIDNKNHNSLVNSIKILTQLTQRDMENSYKTDNVNGTETGQYDRFLRKTYS